MFASRGIPIIGGKEIKCAKCGGEYFLVLTGVKMRVRSTPTGNGQTRVNMEADPTQGARGTIRCVDCFEPVNLASLSPPPPSPSITPKETSHGDLAV